MIVPIIFLLYSFPTIKSIKPKIINGTEVIDRSQFPYQAVLFLYGQTPFCGGTIINEKHVLTAAHCCYRDDGTESILITPLEMFVAVGNLDLYNRTTMEYTRNIYVHEGFDWDARTNDVALLEMRTRWIWSDFIQPISLNTDHSISGNCEISGFGTLQYGIPWMSYKLMYVEVPIVDWEVCNKVYFPDDDGTIGDKVICAGGTEKDACQGDSGGPLICANKLVGIISYGYQCAVKDYPGINTQVSKYIDWIEEHIALTTPPPETTTIINPWLDFSSTPSPSGSTLFYNYNYLIIVLVFKLL